MSLPAFVGLDPSYNGFGIIVLEETGDIIEQKLLTTDSKLEAEDRIIELEKEFKFVANVHNLHMVYVEAPSYSSQGQFILQMGALHYYLRIFFRKHNTPYKVIAPGALKKYVTGSGNAKKELMLLNVYKRWNVEFSDNNLADAFSLARMALDEYMKTPEYLEKKIIDKPSEKIIIDEGYFIKHKAI